MTAPLKKVIPDADGAVFQHLFPKGAKLHFRDVPRGGVRLSVCRSAGSRQRAAVKLSARRDRPFAHLYELSRHHVGRKACRKLRPHVIAFPSFNIGVKRGISVFVPGGDRRLTNAVDAPDRRFDFPRFNPVAADFHLSV
ncbi:Uncharacterised protein [Mycobacteroides abscessus subsp. massiliense]|nr:Uncharacterised protein [Mycobacteroides abscessus subsp. massiliense]